MTESGRTLRVFQVGTGNVGAEMVKRLQVHPGLELVGVHAYSPAKVGRDAGEVVGITPVGVVMTHTVEKILALEPDVVSFYGIHLDMDLLVRVLEAGINVVTTADWINGRYFAARGGEDRRARVEAACRQGGATFYGTGMNPGLLQVLTVAHTNDVAAIEHISAVESVDVSFYQSVQTWEETGFGRPADDPGLPGLLEGRTAVLSEGVELMADCLGLELDDLRFEYELGACTEDVDLGWYQLPTGSLGGVRLRWIGSVGGVDKIENVLEWQMTPHTSPSWEIKGCYVTDIKGDPYVHSEHWILPRPDADWESQDTLMSVGMTATGMPTLNAIPHVVDAAPGVITSADLPLRAFAGRFA